MFPVPNAVVELVKEIETEEVSILLSTEDAAKFEALAIEFGVDVSVVYGSVLKDYLLQTATESIFE